MPYLPPRPQARPTAQLDGQILLAACARPGDRDAIHLRLLSDVAEGRAKIVDSEGLASG